MLAPPLSFRRCDRRLTLGANSEHAFHISRFRDSVMSVLDTSNSRYPKPTPKGVFRISAFLW
jgi:hypothetical protein